MRKVFNRSKRTAFLEQCCFVVCIHINRQDMPCIQHLAIESADIERRNLGFCESEVFRLVDVVVEEGVDFVGVEGATTIRLTSLCLWIVL